VGAEQRFAFRAKFHGTALFLGRRAAHGMKKKTLPAQKAFGDLKEKSYGN
jgi:hypothetical protein